MSPESLSGHDRAERAVIVEAAFRIANERMAAWPERHRDRPAELYLCECADADCREKLSLSREEYESVRADSLHFAVAPGHVIEDLETVVRSEERFEVVEKPAALRDLIVETDPREPGTGEHRLEAEGLAADLPTDD